MTSPWSALTTSSSPISPIHRSRLFVNLRKRWAALRRICCWIGSLAVSCPNPEAGLCCRSRSSCADRVDANIAHRLSSNKFCPHSISIDATVRSRTRPASRPRSVTSVELLRAPLWERYHAIELASVTSLPTAEQLNRLPKIGIKSREGLNVNIKKEFPEDHGNRECNRGSRWLFCLRGTDRRILKKSTGFAL